VNLTDEVLIFDGTDAVPEHCIAVREHLYHGRRGSLEAGARKRNIPIPTLVESLIEALIRTNKTRGDNAPVFQTSVGTSQSSDNLAKRVLKPAAESLGMPWVSWHTLRHTHATFTKLDGMSDYNRQRIMGHASADMTDRYTHEDREQLRAGLDAVTSKLFAKDRVTGGRIM
jgi:integrase